ncbi:hypothetical protein GGI20_005560, partial [Coemansia sp. BCRC 34301]
MLKAFTKVFHKSQGPHDEQLTNGTLDAHQPPAKQPPKRVLERRHPSASGQDADGILSLLPSPRRNAAEAGASSAHVQTPALGPIASPAKRTSVLQRSEKHPPQPRLHLKGPAPGVDGRFALTADNIEWHLRLIPPMKESKYDWIVRYVQEQQQNVAAAATEPPQHQHDIESSINHVSYPQTQNQLPPLPIQQSLTNNKNTTGNARRETDVLPPDNEEDDNMPLAAINSSLSPRHQPTLPSTQPTALNIGHTSCLDRYMTGSLHDPLPEPISPTAAGARLSLVSFQSNIAVNMDTPGPRAVSRSHSMSNPHSTSVLQSNHRVALAELSPAAHYSGPPMFANNPISTRQMSCPIPASSARPSINIISRSKQTQNYDGNSSDDEGDNEPLLPRRMITGNAIPSASVKPNARAPSTQSSPAINVASDVESDSTPALRVVNQVSSHDSDESADGQDVGNARVMLHPPLVVSGDEDEDDDRPLARLTEKHSYRPPPLLNVNTSIARSPITSYNYSHSGPDDDDNRPLSSLMMLANNVDDDLQSSLPLPMPRHVIDPDAVVNISDIINETVTPPRTSFGERPTSPLISTGSTRKHSLLLRSFHPGAQGSETTGGAVAGGTDLVEPSLSELSSAVNNTRSAFPHKRRSNLSSGYSGQLAARESIATDRTSSLPRSLKLVTDHSDLTSIPQLQQQPQPQLVSYTFAADKAI